jgi:hypothetical protein
MTRHRLRVAGRLEDENGLIVSSVGVLLADLADLPAKPRW